MATKKVPSNKIEAGVIKVAGALGAIAGTVAVKKDQLVKKAGEVIDTAKAKWKSITGAKRTAPKKVKKAVKKAATKAKGSVKKAAKKVVKRSAVAKTTVKKTAGKVKKTVSKAGNNE
jgi:hypothetical protein